MEDEENFFVFNPNQRQFIEDNKRYKEKLEQLHTGTYDLRAKQWILFIAF